MKQTLMKRPKILLLTAVFVVAIIANSIGISIGASAWIGDRYQSPEEAFTTIMSELNSDYGHEYETYTYTQASCHSLSGAVSGYVYEFTLDGTRDGFVLMTKAAYENAVLYEVTEIFLDTKSPFYGSTGTNIYPAFLKYYSADDGRFYDLTTGEEVSEEEIAYCEERGFGFNGEGLVKTSWQETVYYSSVNRQIVKTAYGLPGHTAGSNLGSNDCAVTAGKNFINYWDAYKPNLIPNFTSLTFDPFFGLPNWTSSDLIWVGDELYTLMETNSTGNGTTVAQFRNGIKEYAKKYGNYGVTYRSTMTSGYYDINKMVTEFSANRPVALFMSPSFNFCKYGMQVINAEDYFYGTLYEQAGHAMVAYGRSQFTYYNTAGSVVRKFDMLMVAGCIANASIGYIRLNEGYLDINDSFSVEII